MYSYALLETGCHYLIQEKEEAALTLIKINVASDHCMFISRYDETEILEWKKKTDGIHDIVELLSDDKVREWEKSYFNNQDALNYEEGEE
jgi:hypothetical protein